MIIVYIYYKQYNSIILVQDKNFLVCLDIKYDMWNNVKICIIIEFIIYQFLFFQLLVYWGVEWEVNINNNFGIKEI